MWLNYTYSWHLNYEAYWYWGINPDGSKRLPLCVDSGGDLSFLIPLWLRITAKATSFSIHAFVTRLHPCLFACFESLNMYRTLESLALSSEKYDSFQMGLQTSGLGSVLQKTGPVVPTETPLRGFGPGPPLISPCPAALGSLVRLWISTHL